MEIQQKKIEINERMFANQEYEQWQKDELFYMSSTAHLTGRALQMVQQMNEAIKVKWFKLLVYIFNVVRLNF